MTDITKLLELIDAATVHDLGRPMRNGIAQSPNHPTFRHCLDRRHGDRVRADGGSAAADLISTGCHVGTHVDALAHVSHDGLLHGGVSAAEAQSGGRFEVLGIQELPPFVGRGVLLDVPTMLGIDTCEPGYEISVLDLEATVDRQGTPVADGDAVLIRSGWGAHFDDAATYRGEGSGVPGVGEAGAQWLADRGVALAGADTIAFECLAPGAGHALLPAHRVLLVEAGINIIEAMDLDGLAAAGAHEFAFVLAHLNIHGATGAPARPLAMA
ncbi:MAG: cyclase family protein [Acidimicrobiales bacterium]